MVADLIMPVSHKHRAQAELVEAVWQTPFDRLRVSAGICYADTRTRLYRAEFELVENIVEMPRAMRLDGRISTTLDAARHQRLG